MRGMVGAVELLLLLALELLVIQATGSALVILGVGNHGAINERRRAAFLWPAQRPQDSASDALSRGGGAG